MSTLPVAGARGSGLGTLNYRRTGSGEPVLLLHGIGGSLSVWDPVIEPLARERDVIAVDLPGFGDSPALPSGVEPSPAELAAAVGVLLDELELERAHLVGNSLGGWVALEAARQGRALSVTGICPAVWGPAYAQPHVRTRGRAHRTIRRLGPVIRLALRARAVRRLALGVFVAHPERVPYEDAWEMVRSYGRATAYDATSTAMRRGFFSGTEGIDVPVLLAFGDRDRMIRPVRFDRPNFRSVAMPDCGHIPMWDDTDLVSGIILRGTV